MNDKAHVREPVRAVREQATNADALRRVKLLHTIVWAFFASCILAIPIAARTGHMRISLGLIALVAIEVAILFVNGFSCPLTGIAARYTPERQANFDIYLPLWLAKYNKLIFGALYVAAIVYTLVLWRGT